MAKDAGKKSFLDFFKVKNIDDEDEFDDDLFDDDEDDYDDYDDYDDDYVKPKKVKAKPQPQPVQQAAATQQSYRPHQEMAQPRSTSQAGGKLVNFKDPRAEAPRNEYRNVNNGNEVYVIKPHETDEAQYIIDLLIQKRTVVVNIEGLEIAVAQRIIDYIGGACYAMGGSLSGVSTNIFIATPHEVEVSGDLREEIVNQDSLTPYSQY